MSSQKGWVGKVVSTKMQKTAVVSVTRSIVHPLYLKASHVPCRGITK